MAVSREIVSNSPEVTMEFGAAFARKLAGGEVISLTGMLGAGKTHFVKGVARGLGADKSQTVSSPTFVLVNEYFGKFEIYHIDAYRLERESDFEMLGFDDFCHPGAVVIIEWADKVREVLAKVKCVEINISYAGQNARLIKITADQSYLDF